MSYKFEKRAAYWRCLRCGHEWPARKFGEDGRPIPPKTCPNKKCRSPYWNRPRMKER